jgi:hypothetical protein
MEMGFAMQHTVAIFELFECVIVIWYAALAFMTVTVFINCVM